MRIEAIFFDWGGTLCDVSGQSAALLNGAREATRLLGGPCDAQAVSVLAGEAMQAEHRAAADPGHREVDLAAFLANWARRNGQPASDGQVAAAIEAIGRCWVGALRPFPGAVETLRILDRQGVRMGLVSNVWMPPRFCRQQLALHGMADLLDFAVFSSGVGFRKPSPVIYDAALEAAFPQGRPADLSRAVFVGDSPTCDVIAPGQLGLRTVLVEDLAGMWSQADYAGVRPDRRIRSVVDLPAALADL